MVHFSLCPEIGILIFEIGLGRNNFILNYESSRNAARKPRYSVCYIGAHNFRNNIAENKSDFRLLLFGMWSFLKL